ncbi:MAG TPA: hypothetical protein VIF15_17980 [Polyangiaceae bacterium]
MATRRRCSECRCPFTPSPRAQSTQRVCGAECRAIRNRKLARARRSLAIDDYRADECARQEASRGRRAQGAKAQEAEAGEVCHALPSASKSLKLPKEFVGFVDRAVEVSRATLLRVLRRNWPRLRENVATAREVSRASFGA